MPLQAIYSYLPEECYRFIPSRIAKPALEIRAERVAEEVRKKAEHEERQQVIDGALLQYEQQKGGVA